MWVTAPGFYFVERTLLVLGPSGTWWAQLLPFVAGVACIPAIYALARYFKFSRGGGLILAVLVAASPVCVTYSTRVKEYPADFLTACLLIALAERARRRRTHLFSRSVLISVVAFLVSASLGPAIVGLWLALGVPGFAPAHSIGASSWRRRPPPRVAPLWGPSSTGTSHRRRHVFWDLEGVFIVHTSLDKFFLTLNSSAWNLLLGLFGFVRFGSAGRLLVVVGWVALSAVGVYRNPPCTVRH